MKRFYFPFTALILLLLFTTCKDDGVAPDYPTDGLVSYFSFDGNLIDEMGNTLDRSDLGGYGFTDGRRGQALDLNGIDQSIWFNRQTFHKNNQFSVVFWFKTPETGMHERFLFCNDFEIGTASSSLVMQIVNPVTGSAFANYITDQWTHAACTFDGSDMRIYMNGQLSSTINHPGDLHSPFLPLTIGHSGGGVFWEGSLDELFIYNRVLNQEEITTLHER